MHTLARTHGQSTNRGEPSGAGGVPDSGPLEDCVGSDSPPDDMGLTFTNRLAVLKGRSTVVCPCHLEDSRGALNALDPQTLAESLATIQVIDELCDRAQEPCLLLGRQRIEIDCEARQPGVGRQRRLRQRAPAAGLCP